MLAWWSFWICWRWDVFLLLVVALSVTAAFIRSRLCSKLLPRSTRVLSGILSAFATGTGQIAQGRFIAGISFLLATLLAPVLQGFPFVVATAFIDANYLNPGHYSRPEWTDTCDNLFVWNLLCSLYCLPSYLILWFFGVWDAVRRPELRISTIRILGLLLNLVVPGLGAVWATAGSGAHLRRKFYWSGALAVLGGLVWWGYGLLLGCVILFHGRFPPFTWYDLFGYPGGVVPGFFPDLAIWGSVAFVLTSLPVFFLEKRKSNAEGEEGEKNVADQ